MASGGKKGKKKVTMDLYTFMGEGVNVTADKAVVMAPKASVSSWADDVDDEPEYVNRERLILPTAPKAARGVDIDESLIPKNGPYCARVANLPYEVEESDIDLFFKDLKIKSIRMPRDGTRIKGYAFVEFEDKLQLIEAIGRNDLLIKNRKIRVELNLNEDRNRNRGGPRDFEQQEDRTTGDWRSARAELPPAPQGRDYGRDRDRGDRGFGNYGGRSGGFEERGRGGGFSERRQDDRYGDRRGFGGGFERRDRDQREPERPKERQRLQLAPRSKPVEETDGQPTQSSIFGGAKPVDTLKKELEIEQRLKTTSISPPVEEKPKARVDIFGGARPVDTLAREREIEEKLKKDRVEPERPSRSNGYDRPVRSGPNVNRSTSRDEQYRSRESYRSNSRDELRPPRDGDRREYRQSSRDHSPVRREQTPPREPEVKNAWARKPTISQESREEGRDDRPGSAADRDRRTPEPRGRSDRDAYPPSDRGYDRSRDRDERRDDPRHFNGRDSYERRDYRGSSDDRRGRYSDEKRDDRGYETRRQYSNDDRRPYNDDRRSVNDDRRHYDDRRQYSDDRRYDRRTYDQPSRRDEYRDEGRERDGDRLGERKDYGSRSATQDRREPPRSQGDREKQDKKPQEIVPKKYEEPPKPNFAQSSKFSLLNTEDEGIPSGDEE